MLGGDLNEILRMEEILGGSKKDRSAMNCFKETINTCELKDIKNRGPLFTWCNRRSTNCIWEELDRFLCNDSLDDLFQNYFVLHLDWSSSNHRPIELNIQNNQNSRKSYRGKSFKFEKCWSRHLECHDIIQSSGLWFAAANPIPLNQNLENCACALRN